MVRIVSWIKDGCLGCFVDSRLSIRNSSISMGGGVLLGFQCLGPSLGWDGENVFGRFSCDVV